MMRGAIILVLTIEGDPVVGALEGTFRNLMEITRVTGDFSGWSERLMLQSKPTVTAGLAS